MSAGIDTSVNGRGAFISALKSAWHGLGRVFEYAPSMGEILAEPGLSYRVELQEAYACKAPDGLADYCAGLGGPGRAARIPDTFATVRTDTGAALAAVGTRYEVIQHTDEFSEFDSVLSPAGYEYETAGILHGGREVFLLAKRPESLMITAEDKVRAFLLFRFSYDGRSSMLAKAVTERVVCANTLAVALGETGSSFDVKIRHTASAQDRLQALRATLSRASESFERFNGQALALAAQGFTSGLAKDVLAAVITKAHGHAPERPEALARFQKTAEDTLSEIDLALRSPLQHLPGISGTRWSLYNAVSQWADHSFAQGSKGSAVSRMERRFDSITGGHAHDIKRTAWDLLLAA